MIIILSLALVVLVLVFVVFIIAFGRLLKNTEPHEDEIKSRPLSLCTSKSCDFCYRRATTFYYIEGHSGVFSCAVDNEKAKQAVLHPIPQETIRS